MRLKGGARPGEGRVEVLKAGTWGTVCDRKWDLQAASVVCRELGFGSAREALSGARMGQGEGDEGGRKGKGYTLLGENNPWEGDPWTMKAQLQPLDVLSLTLGMGAIHLSEVRCSGQEPSLWKCPHKNITAEDCSHGQDAGVRCNLPYTGVETRVSHTFPLGSDAHILSSCCHVLKCDHSLGPCNTAAPTRHHRCSPFT